METLLSFIQDYGYLFVFIATVLEGETVLALAGFAAFEGYLDLETVIMTALLGGMLGDQAFFYFGRWKGREFIDARPKLAARAKKVQRLIERHQNLLIFGSRFMYGFRIIIPIALGTSKVNGIRFLFLNLLGAAVWSSIFGVGGYMLGTAVETYITNLHKAQKHILLGALLGALIVVGVNFLYRRVEQRALKESEPTDDATLDNRSQDPS